MSQVSPPSRANSDRERAISPQTGDDGSTRNDSSNTAFTASAQPSDNPQRIALSKSAERPPPAVVPVQPPATSLHSGTFAPPSAPALTQSGGHDLNSQTLRSSATQDPSAVGAPFSSRESFPKHDSIYYPAAPIESLVRRRREELESNVLQTNPTTDSYQMSTSSGMTPVSNSAYENHPSSGDSRRATIVSEQSVAETPSQISRVTAVSAPQVPNQAVDAQLQHTDTPERDNRVHPGYPLRSRTASLSPARSNVRDVEPDEGHSALRTPRGSAGESSHSDGLLKSDPVYVGVTMETRSRRPKSGTGSAKPWAQPADKFRKSVPPVKTYLEERRRVPFRDMRGWIETVAGPDCNSHWSEFLAQLEPADTSDNGDEEICRYILSHVVTDQVDPRNPKVKQTRQAVNNAIKRELECPAESNLPARGHTFRDLFRSKCRSRKNSDGLLDPLPVAPWKKERSAGVELSKREMLEPTQLSDPDTRAELSYPATLAVTESPNANYPPSRVSFAQPVSTVTNEVDASPVVSALDAGSMPVDKPSSSYFVNSMELSNQHSAMRISRASAVLFDKILRNVHELLREIECMCRPKLPNKRNQWWTFFDRDVGSRLQLTSPAELLALLGEIDDHYEVYRLLLDFRWLMCHVQNERNGLSSLMEDGYSMLLSRMRGSARAEFDDIQRESMRLVYNALILMRPCLEASGGNRLCCSEFATQLYGRLLGPSCRLLPLAELVQSIGQHAAAFKWWFRPLNRIYDEPMTDMVISTKADDTTVVALSPEGALLAASGSLDTRLDSYTIRLWDIKNCYYDLSLLLLGHKAAVTQLAISACDKWLVSSCAGSGPEILKVWDLSNPQYGRDSRVMENAKCLFVGDGVLVSSIVILSTNPSVLTALRPPGKPSESVCFRIWDLATGSCTKQIKGWGGSWPWRVVASADGKTIVYIRAENTELSYKSCSFCVMNLESEQQTIVDFAANSEGTAADGRTQSVSSNSAVPSSDSVIHCVTFLSESSTRFVVGGYEGEMGSNSGFLACYHVEERSTELGKLNLRRIGVLEKVCVGQAVEMLCSPREDAVVFSSDDGVVRLCVFQDLPAESLAYELYPVGCSSGRVRSVNQGPVAEGGDNAVSSSTYPMVHDGTRSVTSIATSIASTSSASCQRVVSSSSAQCVVRVWNILEYLSNTLALWARVYQPSFPSCREFYGVLDELTSYNFGSIREKGLISGDSLDKFFKSSKIGFLSTSNGNEYTMHPDWAPRSNLVTVNFRKGDIYSMKSLQLRFDKLRGRRRADRTSVTAGQFWNYNGRSGTALFEKSLSPYHVVSAGHTTDQAGLAVCFDDDVVALFSLETPQAERVDSETETAVGSKRQRQPDDSAGFLETDGLREKKFREIS